MIKYKHWFDKLGPKNRYIFEKNTVVSNFKLQSDSLCDQIQEVR